MRLYRYFAFSFVAVGLIIFLLLYFKYIAGGGIASVMADPVIVIVLVVPFMPAAILSFMARRIEGKFIALVRNPESPPTEEKK